VKLKEGKATLNYLSVLFSHFPRQMFLIYAKYAVLPSKISVADLHARPTSDGSLSGHPKSWLLNLVPKACQTIPLATCDVEIRHSMQIALLMNECFI